MVQIFPHSTIKSIPSQKKKKKINKSIENLNKKKLQPNLKTIKLCALIVINSIEFALFHYFTSCIVWRKNIVILYNISHLRV